MSIIEEIEQRWVSSLAGLPPASEIPRALHCGPVAYAELLRVSSSSPTWPSPVSWAGSINVVLGGNASTPGEWILYAADGSEMKRGNVTQVTS